MPGHDDDRVIVSGKIGSTLVRLAVAAGHDVVLSNGWGPQTLDTD